MSWVRIDDKFPRHPKVIAAGPVAAWLYVCGLCYCREHHTGGFIPEKAVPTLGVPAGTRKLAKALASVGLWEQEGDGFRVHDYRAFYEDEADKARAAHRQQVNRENGRLGGLAKSIKTDSEGASTVASDSLEDSLDTSLSSRLALNRYGTGSVSDRNVLLSEEKEKENAPLDQWIRQLQAEYPRQAISAGHLTELAFVQVFTDDPRPALTVWRELMDNLENQKRGKQWRVKQMIPKLEKWLREGLWKQRHEAYSASDLSDATQKTMAGAAAFLNEGKRDDSR